jgi:hypothetical protein
VCQEAGLTTKCAKEWSLELCRNFRGRESEVLSCELFVPFFTWLVAGLFVDSERALLLTDYGTLWVTSGVL